MLLLLSEGTRLWTLWQCQIRSFSVHVLTVHVLMMRHRYGDDHQGCSEAQI